MSEIKVKRALISVTNKEGVVELARGLTEMGVEIISTGGTANTLRENGIDVTDVSSVTGFPEMMNGRVKTLHPAIHGAFLALRDDPEHVAAMKDNGIEPIDLVVVNLYEFEKTVETEGVSLEDAIENIDIGGPAMIRSAAKNWESVAVVTDPRVYERVLRELRDNGGTLPRSTRFQLAVLAYTRTAAYDLAVSSYFAGQLSPSELGELEPLNPLGDLIIIRPDAAEDPADGDDREMPDPLELTLEKSADLRYGENPHQRASLYFSPGHAGLATAEQLHGKEMSYNNYVDAQAAWDLVNEFDERAVAIIKHTNPSGVGLGETNERAYRRALSTDPISAFGGIVAFNQRVDVDVAISVREIFTEVVIAPDFDDAALEVFREKKGLRVLRMSTARSSGMEFKQISGGFLVQEADLRKISPDELTIVSEKQPSAGDLESMLMAWRVCKHVKSNAIVLANANQTLGVGSGQMNRVDSVRIAAMRAERYGLPLGGSSLASDAFFPFRDNVDEAAKLGVGAIIQPGGSVRDDECIEAANEHGLVMAFTGVRHFKH